MSHFRSGRMASLCFLISDWGILAGVVSSRSSLFSVSLDRWGEPFPLSRSYYDANFRHDSLAPFRLPFAVFVPLLKATGKRPSGFRRSCIEGRLWTPSEVFSWWLEC